MKILIVIPTFNEAGNIGNLIEQIFALGIADLNILVVDDNSPDGTARVVEEVARRDPRVSLIVREQKMGLGTAYVVGFKFALQKSYEVIFEMDADLSHDPKEIPNFLEKIDGYQVVIGSRYIRGVNVVNWPLSRLLLSYFANVYARLITGLPIRDCTSGYKCFRRDVLEGIDLDKIHSDGYAFQIEMNFKAWTRGYKLCEIPIIFVDRQTGSSKMSRRIIGEAAWMVWKLKLLSLLRKL